MIIMAVLGRRPSTYCCCLSILLVLLLLMVPVIRAVDDAPAPEDSSLAAKTCRKVFAECRGGVANRACCYAIDEEIRRHKDGHSCVCRQLRGAKRCGLVVKCSKVYCPNCKPCYACPREVDEPYV